MKKIMLFIIILYAFSFINTISDDNSDKSSLIGKVKWNNWKEKSGWDLIPTYEYYFPDSTNISKLQELLQSLNTEKLKFVIFATLTCEECQQYVPKLIRVLEELKIDFKQIELYGLNENLEEPTETYKKYDIYTTPILFIDYDNDVRIDIAYPFLWEESLIEVFEELK